MASAYPVYKIRYNLAVQDPDTIGTRYHTVIFVQTEADGSGDKHHVTGDITNTNGMTYECKTERGDPSDGLHSKELLGYTNTTHYPQAWKTLLSNVAPPPRQKAFNPKSMRTEPFKTLDPLTFYEPGEARRPLIKCTEWMEDRALPALWHAGLICQNQS